MLTVLEIEIEFTYIYLDSRCFNRIEGKKSKALIIKASKAGH